MADDKPPLECFNCDTAALYECPCGEAVYCSQNCQEHDAEFHVNECLTHAAAIGGFLDNWRALANANARDKRAGLKVKIAKKNLSAQRKEKKAKLLNWRESGAQRTTGVFGSWQKKNQSAYDKRQTSDYNKYGY